MYCSIVYFLIEERHYHVKLYSVLFTTTNNAMVLVLGSNGELARAAALQSVAVRRSTGNDVVATISAVIFHFFTFFSVATFSRIKKLI